MFTENISGRKIAEEKLTYQAFHDHLTGLANRRVFFEAGRREIERFRRAPRPLALLVLDVDHFKRVNDTHGHGVGDQVLRLAANTLAAALRRGDLLVRWGGEEFLVLLADADAAVLARITERLRVLVERSFLMLDGHRLNFTASLGATLAQPDDTPEALIARADALMYQSKQAGRNCVTIG